MAVNATASGPRQGRILERGLAVSAFVLLAVTMAADASVRTAYDTDWLRLGDATEQATAADPAQVCANGCARLPSGGIEHVYAGAAALVVLALAVAVWRWASGVGVGYRLGGPALLRAMLVLAVVLGAVGGWERHRAAAGDGASLVGRGAALTVAALALIVAVAVIVANKAVRGDTHAFAFAQQLRHFLHRQRAALIAVALYAVVLLLLPQTSGQAIDELRTWDFGHDPAGWAKPGFGVASAVLLALVIYESGVRLDVEVRAGREEPDHGVWGLLVVIAAVLTLVGSVLAHQILWGLVVLTGLLVALLVASFVAAPRDTRVEDVPAQALTGRPARTVVEGLAIVPLAILAAAVAVAVMDRALVGGSVGPALPPLVAAVALVVAAMLMVEPVPAGPDRLGRALARPGPGAIAAGVAVVGLVVGLAVGGGWWTAALGMAALVVSLGLAGVVLHAWADRNWLGVSVLIAPAVGVAVLVAVHVDAQGTGAVLGATAFVNLSIAALLAVFYFAALAGLRWQPPGMLARFGVRELPVLTLLVVWWLAAGALTAARRDELHDARLIAPAAALARAPTFDEAFDTWVAAQPELRSARAGGGAQGSPVPLVLVAADGGGIRAAYWTALALDCVVGTESAPGRAAADTCREPRRKMPDMRRAAGRVFLLSGVSGGAVGFAAYARELLSGGLREDWVAQRLGDDFASPTVGWGLFHDLPNHLIGATSRPGGVCAAHLWRGGPCLTRDRAAVLEQTFDQTGATPGSAAFERLRTAWALRAAHDAQQRALAATVPLVVTNATRVGGADRVSVSAADLAPWPAPDAAGVGIPGDPSPLAGSRDVVNMLCNTSDLRLTTAAILGARFPYVSPSGRVGGQDCSAEADPNACGSPCATSMVDGGYSDNSGLLTIDTLWPQLARRVAEHNAHAARPIAPIVVELDNHYHAPNTFETARGAQHETLVPPMTAFGLHTFVERYSREEAFHLAGRNCVLALSPELHPGLKAPLGWTLSRSTRDELQQALTRSSPAAVAATRPDRDTLLNGLRSLEAWLSPELTKPAADTLARCVLPAPQASP
jgi:hypothetical protein